MYLLHKSKTVTVYSVLVLAVLVVGFPLFCRAEPEDNALKKSYLNELYSYAQQQEDALNELSSISIETREVMKANNVILSENTMATVVSDSSQSEKVIIGGRDFYRKRRSSVNTQTRA